MKRRSALLLGLLAVSASPALSDDLRGIYARTQPSVLVLKTFDRFGAPVGQGTGFAVAAGLIVTNYHVIDGARSVQALGQSERVYRVAALLRADEKNDIAVLRAEPGDLPGLELAQAPAVVGQRVVVVGNPLGLAGTLSEGLVSALRPEGLPNDKAERHKGGPLLQITAPISHGSSGSPVMDESGKVVGVAVSGYTGEQGLNFAVPVAVVSSLLSTLKPGERGQDFGGAPGKTSRVRNVVISVGVLALVAVALYLAGGKRSGGGPRFSNGGGPEIKTFRGRT